MGIQSVMLIEDDEDSRTILAEILSAEGYEVRAAGSGAEALENLEANAGTPPDLVLLDLVLPDIDGLEVLGRLQAEPSLAQIPVVVVSALFDAPTLGVAAVLRKPFEICELLERMKRIVERRGIAAAAPASSSASV